MDSYHYYKGKVNRNIRIYIGLFLTVFLGVAIYALPKHLASGTYSVTDAFMVCLVFLGFLFVTWLGAKLLAILAFKSEQAFLIAIVIALVLGFWHAVLIILPARRYHRGDEPGEDKEERFDNRVFRATVKAYQKTWREQNFFARVVLPLIVAAAAVGIYFIFDLVYKVNENAFAWIVLGIFVVLAFLMLAALGGIRDVRVKTTEYNVSVGTGWLDYGEVYVSEGSSTVKDETRVSCLGLLLCLAATPFLVFAFVILLAIWTAIDLLLIILPIYSRHTIYTQKKTAIHSYYVPGPGILKRPMVALNRFMRAIFRISFVNKDFWIDGVGPRYIEEYLSPRRRRKLEKRLDRVERKYGYRHYW